jgi:hypothetical protein
MATTLVLASLLQAVATTALADGDDVSARFLADLPSATLYATPVSCSVPATEGRACIS